MAMSHRILAVLIVSLAAVHVIAAQFDYSQQPIPNPFQLGDRYPDREEVEVCRPIVDHVDRNSARFTNELVLNPNPDITFSDNDARRMTSRMQTRLDRLRELYTGGFTVLKAWTQYPDPEVGDIDSLHYEGRTIRVRVHSQHRISEFLTRAVQAAFDWVSYENNNYVRLSVIPDYCEANVDMVFMLDQSGSVGRTNHDLAIQFIMNVVQFFTISPDTTRVGFVAYSTYSHLEFDLNRYINLNSLLSGIGQINYRGGWTATALALNTSASILDPANNRGARPASEGIPKIAILITDGKSNLYPLTYAVPNIKRRGVQVYTIGIVNPDVDELRFISSDPDNEHVFLLNSYNDAAGFVDFISVQTCDTPAIVDPGENTTTEVPEGGIRYFQVECDSFSNTVVVELYDNAGTSFLFCSATEQNPGPLTQNTIVNDTIGITVRTCVVTLTNPNSRVVYIGIQGQDGTNQFTLVVWDLLFTPDRDEDIVLEGETGVIYDVSENLNNGANGITFVYHIVDGNENNLFTINNNGQVRVPPTGLDFADGSFYSLLIVAENVDRSCQRSRFRLDIIVGRNVIDFPNLPPVSIPETSSVGTEVATIQASGGAGSILYSLVSNNVPFMIESMTGSLVVDGSINYEDVMSYAVIVRAESVGTIVSGTATQTVHITDVNEQPVWVTQCALDNNCEYSVTENSGAQNVGPLLEVMDPDLSSVSNGQIDYEIDSPDSQLPFSVGSNGQVHIVRSLDREAREMYSFTVVASDRGNPSLSVQTTFRVRVMDVNDVAPFFIQGPTAITIAENEPQGNIIAQYIARDNDTMPNAQITYTLSPSVGIPFSLDENDGVLSVSGLIDYEDPNSREFSIDITANNPPYSTPVRTLITVTDENDNTPTFTGDYTPAVPEHSASGTLVDTVLATDADSGTNGEVVYSIVGGNSQGLFAIDSEDGSITIAGDIDREQVPSFELRIRARDRGSPRLSSFTTVIVEITDINDHSPVFNPDTYTASLREDLPVNTEVFTVFATDSDEPGNPNSEIVYNIVEGNTGDAFAIDGSGIVTINTMLNHEETSSYTLLIQAADQGTPQMFGTATATVTVVNVNEAPPSLSGNQTVNISEAAPINFPVATFSAIDPDFMPVSITINSGNEEGKFAISNGGMISLAAPLDFETTQTYFIGVVASDGQQSDQAFLLVHVVDENEFAPEFDGPSNFEIEEERASGILVGSVHATDRDGSSPNNEVTYSTTHNNFHNYFTLDSSTGDIRTSAILNREELTEVFPVPSSSLSVTIFARDGGSPTKQDTTTITITLVDINDNTPEFSDDEYTTSLLENQPPQVILTISASDLDLGSNGDIRYSFTVSPLSGNSLFQIEGNEISTTGGLDCELEANYSFTIVATDQGSPPLSSSVVGTLAVLDQNDNSPIFTENVYTFVVSESAVIETVVGQVVATDADKGTNGEVVYSIINQDDFEVQAESTGIDVTFFEIDANTGEIIHVTPFDFESFPQVNITVQANDRGIPRRSSTALVVFNVNNVDELRPQFLDSCDDTSVSENTPINSVIVNCTAIDLDNTTTPDDPDWITYTIVSGNDDNTFMIVPNTGVIHNRVELDYETEPYYDLDVKATDGSGRSRTTSLTIDILDENDNAPQFLSASYLFSMTEEAIEAQTQEIATVRARDEDSSNNGEVVYSIEDSGVERVSKDETRITITARDRGDTPQVSSVTLTVTFEDECLLQKYTVNKVSGVVRADVLCAVEIRPSSTDVILGSTHTAYCRVVRNSLTTYQWILNGNAIDLSRSLAQDEQEAVLNVDSVGYEDAGVYACKVTTEAGSLQTSTYSVNILVPPIITIPPQSSSAEEGSDMEFRCTAIGTPPPSIQWEFGGGMVGNGNTLTIEKADILNQGEYSCVATNSAGSSSSAATLTVYKLDNVVQMVLNNINQPSQDGTCQYLDLQEIQDTLTTLSGVTTMVTATTGDNLCDVNPCSSSPCQNQGSCLLDESVMGGYRCTCQDGYQGAECEEDVNECLADPCGTTGVCTNTPGFYHCECSGSRGHRCQYPDSCNNGSCGEGALCIESLMSSGGYFCEASPDPNEVLVVIGVKVNPGFLDDLLVTYREELLQSVQQQSVNNRRKREGDDPIASFANNLCTPRFIKLEDSMMYGLFWDCPDGSSRPNTTIESLLCQRLLQSGLVESCKPTNMTAVTTSSPPPLPKISVTIDIIQVDNSGQSLPVGETLRNLEEAAEEIAKSVFLGGAQVGEISALNPITCTPECVNGECTDRDQCTCDSGWTGEACDKEQQSKLEGSDDNTGLIAGVVVGVTVFLLVSVAIVIIAYIMFTKHKEHKKRQALKEKYAVEMATMQANTSPDPKLELHSSTTQLIDEDNDYDELPPVVPSKTPSSDAPRKPNPALSVDEGNDYDVLPPVASSKTSPSRVQDPDDIIYENINKEKEGSSFQ